MPPDPLDAMLPKLEILDPRLATKALSCDDNIQRTRTQRFVG